ncbi:hypothetical protein AAVH_31000 [Aphelenchoides avenae]|nr:hypothetical protein AAVH_31000 [Aphelenchus avenae]
MPQSAQKQSTIKALDTQPLLLPTASSTNVDVEVVSVAYFAARVPRAIQDTLSSKEAELRRSPPLPPINMEFTFLSLPRAERNFQLVLMRPSPRQNVTLPLCFPLCSTLLPCRANLSKVSYAVLMRPSRHLPTAIQETPTFKHVGSCSERFSDLRSLRDLRTHARGPLGQQALDSAHQEPRARNAHTTEDALQRSKSSQQPTPQSLTSRPADSLTARLPQQLPQSTRVRIDPRQVAAADRPTDATNHATQRLPAPAASDFSSSTLSKRVRVHTPRAPNSTTRLKLNSTSRLSARTTSSMVKRSNKKPYSATANDFFKDDASHVITEADGSPRALKPDELDRAVEMNPDKDERMQAGQDAPVPAYSAGQVASQTAQLADPAVPPAYSAGATGDAHRNSQRAPAAANKFSAPTTYRKKKRVAKPKSKNNLDDTQVHAPPLVPRKTEVQRLPGRREEKHVNAGRELSASAANPTVLPTYSVGASGYACRRSYAKPAVPKPSQHASFTTKHHQDARENQCSSVTAATPITAKLSAKKRPVVARGHAAHGQARSATKPTMSTCRRRFNALPNSPRRCRALSYFASAPQG